ncbi:neck protein [Gordonia phage Ronaldo]|uniref:Uncharacterized protein n=4 Tax=Ronaldovirus TaxID=2733205 RepID=A0A6B9LEF5_9CAUD|nr:neck protein [Gordonia phage Fryberger]YP_009807742.1 neck protein [Gordonia phage Ronaldo]QDH48385.1 hypothetical protein SEA_ZIKO_46 [Gordonia phage Ziko]QHB38161.1 hypothetical protein SEA_VOLT_45 [Gordonia phage Volt]QTF81833.1 hypothetical protein SEA_GUEY18_48 [Gordonia phage Guey18]AXN53461.1 hypothetical protein SEA_FRYBERGER_43 [Gordonia phage Fryberger]AXN53608.1 hypothetical protein SEA_RONALDO_46 [Gordonia phage Ronaldo]
MANGFKVNRIKWNIAGFRELRSNGAAQSMIDERLQAICDYANSQVSDGGFDWESHMSVPSPQGRWRGTVFPTTSKARAENARHNILIQAVHAGG